LVVSRRFDCNEQHAKPTALYNFDVHDAYIMSLSNPDA